MRYWLQAIAANYVHDSEHADDKPASAGTKILTFVTPGVDRPNRHEPGK